MLFLLDTNAVSDIVDRHPGFASRLAALGVGDTVAICTIVRGEILFGLERLPQGQRRRELEIKVLQVMAGLPCHPVPEAAADHYARTKRACQQKGLPLDENDLWIAATALSLGATVVTRDQDFRQVDGLPIEDWTK